MNSIGSQSLFKSEQPYVEHFPLPSDVEAFDELASQDQFPILPLKPVLVNSEAQKYTPLSRFTIDTSLRQPADRLESGLDSRFLKIEIKSKQPRSTKKNKKSSPIEQSYSNLLTTDWIDFEEPSTLMNQSRVPTTEV